MARTSSSADTITDTTPYWTTSASIGGYPALERAIECDVLVVGGGITGITSAYLLQQAGRRVALVERGRCASMDTGHTTGHLTCVTDARLADMVDVFGEDHARAVWDAGLAAIAQIEDIAAREHIDCGLARVPGYLHLPAGRQPDAAAIRALQRERALATTLGFDAEFIPRVPVVDRPGVMFAGQARFHPRLYLRALLDRIHDAGGLIFERSSVSEIIGDPIRARVNGHEVRCADVVVATHSPIAGRMGFIRSSALQTAMHLYTSYVVGARVPSGAVPDALFWDTDERYHYLRVDPRRDFDYVIFGGEDHKTGQAEDTERVYERLVDGLRALVPDAAITHHWSGQVIKTTDGLPMMGYAADHQYVATGYAGNGMTFGTLGAMMARDAITGVPNRWRDLFDIHRPEIRVRPDGTVIGEARDG
jgi:glycine/D-amino acid oxidase-like deaminating enzyme